MENVSDNVGQVAVFKVNSYQQVPENSTSSNSSISRTSDHPILIVVNTHIVYSPKNGHVKLWQTLKLLEQISFVKELYKDCQQSVVFSGDFNSVANSGLWSLICDGKLDATRFTRSTVSLVQLYNCLCV